MTTKRALVLAGGGVVGIAWETGVLRGISDESPATAQALVDSAVLVGTSAGSTVAAQLSSGMSLDDLFARQLDQSTAERDPGVGTTKGHSIAELFLAAVTTPGISVAEKLIRIGAIALDADTVGEPVRRDVIAHRLPVHEWPDRELRITAMDIASGKLVVFDSASGAGLVDAVAASCAVPGVWPPVTISGRRYMDGGVGSGVNMAVADECDTAVVLVPSDASAPSPFGMSAAAEIAAFHGNTFAVFADPAALEAFGPNPLDLRRRAPSAVAGRQQGRREAPALAEFLGLSLIPPMDPVSMG